MPKAVVFDVMGTLFDLAAVRERLAGVGAPSGALEAWFGRMLHAAASLTLVGEFRPFRELAEKTLQSVLAQLDADPERAGGWDVVGARAAGLQAVWVDRLERRWPFPLPEPPWAGDLRAAVELALSE